MDLIVNVIQLAGQSSWDSWAFPGLSHLSDMIALAFWWELAFVLAAIPILIFLFVVYALLT